jgi:hypothetical protein
LVAFGEIQGLRWVLEHQRMAFSEGLSSRARSIDIGDELVLYVTRGAFHNPTRDRSQFVGLAGVTGPVRRARAPIVIAGREFVSSCPIEVEAALPERTGVMALELVPQLSFIKRKEVWGQYLRWGLVKIPGADHRLIRLAIRSQLRTVAST